MVRFLLTKIKEKTPAICQIRATGDLVHRADEEARTQAEKVKLFPLSIFSFQVKLSYGTNAGEKLCILLPWVFFRGNKTFQSSMLSVYKRAEDFFH